MAEQAFVPHRGPAQTAGVRVDEDFIGIAKEAAGGIERAVHPVPVEAAGLFFRQQHGPEARTGPAQGNAAEFGGIVRRVKKAQLNPFGRF